MRLTHLDKVLFPDNGITKARLIDYYVTVANALLPYLSERPVAMHWCPEGIYSQTPWRTWQKDLPEWAPDWLDRMAYQTADGRTIYWLVVNSLPSLVWAVNHAAIDLHPWSSRRDKLGCPVGGVRP